MGKCPCIHGKKKTLVCKPGCGGASTLALCAEIIHYFYAAEWIFCGKLRTHLSPMSKGAGEYCQAASCEKDNTMYFCPADFVREKAVTAPTLFRRPFLAALMYRCRHRGSHHSHFSAEILYFFFHFKWLKKGSLSPRIPICRSRAPGDVRAHRCNLVQVCHTGLRTNMQNHLQNRPPPTGWSRANKDTFPWIIHHQMWFSVSPGFAEEAVTFVTTNTRLQTSDEITVVRRNTDLSAALFLFCPFYQHKCLFTRHQGTLTFEYQVWYSKV